MSGRRARPAGVLAARLALAALLGITLVAVAGSIATPFDPAVRAAWPLSAAAEKVPLGSDDIGRDLLSRLLSGWGMLWLPSLAVACVSALAGTLVGAVWGAADRWTACALGWLTHAVRAVPAPLAAVAVAATLRPGTLGLAATLALFGWPWQAGAVRAALRAARLMPYAQAAALAGTRTTARRIAFLLPSVLPMVAVAATRELGGTVLTLATLTFLGLGDPRPASDLGAMAAAGMSVVLDFPRVTVLPVLLVFAMAATAFAAAEAFRRRLERP